MEGHLTEHLKYNKQLSLFNISKKEKFLSHLKSKGSLDYKRYLQSPLRYAGGKSLAVGYVIEQMPEDVTYLVSPFFGGGSVEIACANELDIKVQGYDIFDILVNYWNVQLKFPNRLAKKLTGWTPNKETYKQVKERLKGHWDQSHVIDNYIDLAAHYWFNHNLSYGPGFLGWMSKIYEEKERVDRLIDKVKNFRCSQLNVSKGSFETAIPQHKKDFLYCDPPYFLDGDSKMFKGIYPQRNFPVHHNGFDHKTLCDLLHKHHGGFILSYNDCETIRKWYADFDIVPVQWQYTLGQGETRIGKNRMENGTNHYVKQSHELLIVKKS